MGKGAAAVLILVLIAAAYFALQNFGMPGTSGSETPTKTETVTETISESSTYTVTETVSETPTESPPPSQTKTPMPTREELEEEFGYRINATLPEIPEKSPVVVLEVPEVNGEYAITVARVFNVEPKNVTERSNYYRVFDGRYAVKVYKKSGAVFYQDTERLFKLSEGDYSLTDEEARKIADQVLERYNLLPSDPRDKAYFYNIRHLYSATGGGKTRIEDAEVIYRREINGIPVLGPGSIVVVYLDNEGNLIGLYRDWKPLKELSGEMPNDGMETAFSRMKTLDDSWNLTTSDITVYSAAFGYYDGGRYSGQNYLQPSLIFKRDYGENEITYAYIAVPTLEEPMEEMKG
ncbi:hypothetical protein A3L11_09580 [Thermococcus siculi]|uniref:Regulatory protein YycH-like domain-containing protein n=1 Tax=Thermococcus siculi TaxID=72803 RepID=A0A2Z2MUJ1_9EURY|nr:hypothetical protein [Thermococcus siculi]ASJ09466.1 hypothetical protein A3L11_09580 [Thermococcus siculi]